MAQQIEDFFESLQETHDLVGNHIAANALVTFEKEEGGAIVLRVEFGGEYGMEIAALPHNASVILIGG